MQMLRDVFTKMNKKNGWRGGRRQGWGGQASRARGRCKSPRKTRDDASGTECIRVALFRFGCVPLAAGLVVPIFINHHNEDARARGSTTDSQSIQITTKTLVSLAAYR